MTESGAPMAFDNRRTEAARAFLRTVVVVDDKPVRRSPQQPPAQVVQPVAGTRPPIGASQDRPSPIEVVATPPSTSTATAPAEDPTHELDGDALQAAFADEGLVCSVLFGKKPTDDQEAKDWIKRVVTVGSRTDVLVLDWSWNGDHGVFCKQMIDALLKTDSCRRQLVIIYTAEDDKQVFETRLTSSSESSSDSPREQPQPRVTSDTLRFSWPDHGLDVVVVQKFSARGEDFYRGSKVREKDLPERVFKLFGEVCGGLLANAAMHGLGHLRESTHGILRRFRPELDAPYVVHRACSSPRESAQEQVRDLLVDALGDALTGSEVTKHLDDAPVEAWLKTCDGIADRWAKIDGLKGRPSHDALANGSLDTRNTKRKTVVAMTEALVVSESSTESTPKRDHALAEFIYCADETGKHEPALRLGTILSTANGGDLLVCTVPLCDSDRVPATGQKFPFLPLTTTSESGSLALTIPGSKDIWYVPVNVCQLTMLKFVPPRDQTPVRAQKEADGFVFTDDSRDEYRYVGRLRPLFAQRLAQELGAKAARVGVAESEFIRRRDK